MNDALLPEAAAEMRPDTTIYLEKDIFVNFHLSRLEGPAATVALNFRECILLRLLLGARVRKQAVIDAAWGDNGVIVTDASYHQLVRSLRKKFEEIGLPAQSIRTLPRFGLEYLREQPPAPPATQPVPAIAALVGNENMAMPNVAGTTPEQKQVMTMAMPLPLPMAMPMPRGSSPGMKWSLRLLLLILPFLAGLLIGHLGYRGNMLASHRDHAPGLAVSAPESGCIVENIDGGPACSKDGGLPTIKTSLRVLRTS